MSTRAIGFDHDGTVLRVVILQIDKGRETLLQQGSLSWDGTSSLATVLRSHNLLPAVGDRSAFALPAGAGFTRTLHLPFADRRKIAAVLPLELAAQLPLPVDDCVIDHLEPQPEEKGAAIFAAAVPAAIVARGVSIFDADAIPLQTVDLATTALCFGLEPDFSGSIVVALGDCHALIVTPGAGAENGRTIALGNDSDNNAALLARELAPELSRTPRPVRLCGSRADQTWIERLADRLPQIDFSLARSPAFPDLAPQMLPALALARRASRKEGLNFRRGAFSRHGESTVVRSRLLTLGGIFAAALVVLIVSFGLRWSISARQENVLRQELNRIYREAVPGEGAIVDVPLQLKAKLKEIARSARPGGQHPDLTPLALLREISSLAPSDIGLTIREWSISPDEIRIDAVADSFDAANRLSAALSSSPRFKSVRIDDSKSRSDGKRIDFRLTIVPRTGEELP